MERLTPISEGFCRQEGQTGSHKYCLPLTKWWKRMTMYSYISSNFGKNE